MRIILKVCLFLLLATLLIYSPFLIHSYLLLERGNDLTEFFWPIYYFVKNEILAGRRIPLWNPHILSGTPLLPDPQAPIFYLPNLVFLILPINTAFIVSLFLHTFLAGLFFYLLLNSGFKFSRLSSLIGAFLYIASPNLASHLEAGHVGLVYAWTWVPLAILAVKKLVARPDVRFSIILSIALAFLFFSHTLIFIFSCFALTIFYLLSNPQKSNILNFKFLGLGFILTFGLIAVSLLPQIEWQKDTTRYLLLQIRDIYPKWNGKKEFLKALVAPWLGGVNNIWKFDTEKFITLGILPTLLAILGFLKLDNKKKFILGGLLVAIALISLNNLSPISQLFLKLDPFVLTRVATRPWFLVIIITIILVSYGLEKSRNRFKYLIAVLAVGESLFLSHKILAKPVPPSTTAPKEVYEFLSSDKDPPTGEAGRFRVFCTTRCLSQKESVIYNLELIDGYSTLIQKNYNSHAWQLTGAYWDYYTLSIPPVGAYTFEKLQPQAKPLGEYNTKYVISLHPLKDKNFILVKKINNYLIYQNQLFQPRSPAPIISYTPNQIRIDTSNFKEKSLTISEVYSPGWKACLNGTSEVAVQETPEHKRLIDLFPNTKFVELKYQPNSYQTGKTISIITILTLLLLSFGGHLNRKISFFKNILALDTQLKKGFFLKIKNLILIFFQKNDLAVKFLIILISLIFSFSLLELALRSYQWLANKEAFGLKPVRTTLKFYENEIFGHAPVPNQNEWFVPRRKEYTTRVEINSKGWPDIEHSYEKPTNTFRIVILGDSFVENIQVSLEKRFFRQLEKELNEKLEKTKKEINLKKFEIIALGRGNTGTAQQFLILKNFALKYQPDLIIQVFFTGNDVKNNSFKLQNDPYLPYFDLDDKNNLILISQIKRSGRKFASLKELLKNFRLVELLLSVRQNYLERKGNHRSGYPLDYHIYNSIYSDEYEKAWKITKKLIIKSQKETESLGVKYLLVVLANNEQINQSVQQKLFKEYPLMKTANLNFEKPDRILKEFCIQEKIDCLFMLPYFQEFAKKNPDQPTHNYYEGHWNQTGTNLAAEFLREKLEDYFKIK